MKRFAHESEERFARILDFYGVRWEYSRSSSLSTGTSTVGPTAGFRPDFWLPQPGLFVEVTTLNQRLVTKKNGKVRAPRASSTLTCGSPSSTNGTPWRSWPSTDWPATDLGHVGHRPHRLIRRGR